MSADNWRVCPKCYAKKSKELGVERLLSEDLYGDAQSAEIQLLNWASNHTKMREDWELGLRENGEFFVIYRAACYDCDFRYEYKYEKKIK